MNKSSLSLLLIALFVTVGCGDNNRQSPYIMGEKPAEQKRVYSVENKNSAVTIAGIEAETQKEIAKINKERDVELHKIEQDTRLIELKSQNAIADKEHNLSAFVSESEAAFKNSSLIVIVLTIFSLLALTLYIFRKRREDRLKMHEDEMQKELYIREKELQVQMAGKILDTIASGQLSPEREQYLLEALDKTTKPTLPHQK